MKKELDENAILHRMTREELAKVKGGDNELNDTDPGEDKDQGACGLLAGCGDIPKQTACDRCLA